MKKSINFALGYAIAAMAGGVFYREFTKWNGFTGKTALGVVHAHLFLLGCVLFLLVGLFCAQTQLAQQKHFGTFLVLHSIGLPLTSVMFVVRGITQVLGTPLSKGADAAISGIAGIGHILLGAAIVTLLLQLRKAAKN